MIAILEGGPANGTVVNMFPGLTRFRYAVPPEIDNWTVITPVVNPELPRVPIALYEFTGIGYVTLSGETSAVIYRYRGMEKS